ncbi:MAG: zinc-ribbon domain-containing protein [Leptospirales bacterium]|nr:zinc-ribbon domain-containing protein [Leptospirales bacterium]MCL2155569.1 zinc-ribbon domain-containing protein [Leptospirales bacterium]
MIVRCNNCVSAFSVDDDKVADKIFAFTCPKCSTENIINNKIKNKQAAKEAPVFDDDFMMDSGTDDTIADNESFEQSEQDFPTDESFDMEEDPNTEKLSDNSNRKLNLEIEESDNIHDIDFDDSIFEESLNDTPAPKEEVEDIFSEAASFEPDEMEIPLTDEFDIELEKDTDIVKDDKDIIFDDFGDIDLEFEEDGLSNKKTDDKTEAVSDDDLAIDIDDLDIDLVETSEPIESNEHVDSDDITIDMDNLDIDLVETNLDDTLADHDTMNDKKNIKSEPNEDLFDDEDIKLNLDELDIDIDEIEDRPISEDEFESIESKEHVDSDDITIDMDNLDIDLVETNLDDTLADHAAMNDKKNIKSDPNEDLFDDEDIKLNLDELDIDIDEIEDRPISEDEFETIESNEHVDSDDITIDIDNLDIDIELDETYRYDTAVSDKKNIKSKQEPDDFDDEDIKLNLDELDIDIDEIGDKEPIVYEDTGRLSLDDADLTFDELTPKTKIDEFNELSDDEIRLTLEDIDPDLTLEEIIKTAEADSKLALDSLEELPEIYQDEYDSVTKSSNISKKSPANMYLDEMLVDVVDDTDYDISDYDESEEHERNERSTSFSIDFSLKYSRIQAILRLLFLYLISMIPHFIVLIIYTVLSSILALFNQLVILATGRCVNDFGLIIENTMRYILYINTNLIGIVDDRPVYAGRMDIDHPLQFDVTFPLMYSKKMAILRVSIIGITIFTLPHIIIIALLSLTIPICYLIGILSVIITSQWPNILFKYIARYFRYIARVSAFMLGLTDDYPSFRI